MWGTQIPLITDMLKGMILPAFLSRTVCSNSQFKGHNVCGFSAWAQEVQVPVCFLNLGKTLNFTWWRGLRRNNKNLLSLLLTPSCKEVVPLEVWLYFCFSYKWKLFWHTLMSVFTGQPYRSHLAQVLWCCGNLFLQPCFNGASLCPLKRWTATVRFTRRSISILSALCWNPGP